MGTMLAIIGLIVALVGGIWLLVEAFRESILWGLGALFIPFVGLIFAILHWDKGGKPLLIGIVGNVIMFAGRAMAGGG